MSAINNQKKMNLQDSLEELKIYKNSIFKINVTNFTNKSINEINDCNSCPLSLSKSNIGVGNKNISR